MYKIWKTELDISLQKWQLRISTTLSYLHEGSLEIMLLVPLKKYNYLSNVQIYYYIWHFTKHNLSSINTCRTFRGSFVQLVKILR